MARLLYDSDMRNDMRSLRCTLKNLGRSPEFLFIGRLPPPVTGENICRRRLREAVEAAGFGVRDVQRHDRGAWTGAPLAVVLINGHSLRGSLIDFLLTLWWGSQGRPVFWYFHNRSWRRFARVPAILWPMRDWPRPIVITRAIYETFADRGYEPVLMRNAAEPIFSPRKEPQLPKHRLVFVGRLHNAKGFYTALEVFKRLREIDDRWIFDIYGSGDDVGEKIKPLGSSVHLHGWVTDEQKLNAYTKGGIIIFPSLSEVLPMVIIEAFSQAIPAVASSVGGIPEMIGEGHGSAGIVVRDGSVASYVAAVQRVLGDYNQYSESALRVFNLEYNEERFQRQVRKIFGAYLCGGDTSKKPVEKVVAAAII